ncbi:dethiobiotin synthase [Polynucleobacter wuianus]|uniref:ATP-dependent dethiobiotin synthetase BioD n=1 Tax=Polynucleobacter wuianus TaxID=1743168 RepID=A0A191UCM7_9BURK|nr:MULTISPECIES: dethiobiotin synthase [Polynucleobacter]ANI98769.1 dethiobiotin synthase [Polynucleobacter wuianus]MBU3553336.1 dethiobiotin synthase [Polynucleobacter sp. MWH-Post4-6-1]
MYKNTGFFIAGTDTEVGKTLVSGALILKLREQGKKVLGFKPVVAGTYQSDEGQLLNEDLETLRLALGLTAGQPSLCPYVLDMPAAPHLVAESKGIRLELNTVIQAYSEIQQQGDCIVVEGAGGFLTPLNNQENLGDFANQIQLPIILVVGMKLGCINHALLSMEAFKTRNLKVAGWIANTLSSEMQLLAENIETLRSKIDAPFLGSIPQLPPAIKKPDNRPYCIEALAFAAQHIRLPSL